MALNPGGLGYAGYIDWYRNGPTRLAYLGYQDMAGSQYNLSLNLENGANFVIGGGKVGIGTANPQVSLDVIGPIQVTGNMTQQWGDYVNYVQYPSAYAANPTFFMGWKTDTPTSRLLKKQGLSRSKCSRRLDSI
jgi:hypothetical protein